MEFPPPTERLAFRDWGYDDVDAMIEMYSREDVYRFLGSAPSAVTEPELARARIDRWRGRGECSGIWAVTLRDQPRPPIGTILMLPLPLSTDGSWSETFEIGWQFHPSAWGNGYATEAGQAMIARARAARLPEVRAVLHAENRPSRAVCERLGMSYLGPTDQWYGVTLEEFRLPL